MKLSQLGADTKSSGRFQRITESLRTTFAVQGWPHITPSQSFHAGPAQFSLDHFNAGCLLLGCGRREVSIVDVRDILVIAVLALTEPGHEVKTYEITGPELLTHTTRSINAEK